MDLQDWGYDMPEASLDPPPLQQLRARCLTCMHDQTVGTPFRHRTDPIQLDETRETRFSVWAWMQLKNKTVRLFCADCERPTWQAPRGSIEVDE